MLRAERGRLNGQARKLAQERNGLHGEAAKLRSEAQSLREKRDDLNSEIQQFKILREEARKDYFTKIDDLRELRKKIKEVMANKPRRSARSLEDEIKAIEWKIQTESPSLNEERKMVNIVKALEGQLQVYRERKRIADKIDVLENEVKRLNDKALAHRERTLELAQQSQGFHGKMVEKLTRMRELRAKANELHKEYISYQEKAKAVHSKCLDIMGQIKAIRDEIRRKEERETVKLQACLKERLTKEALAKLKRGERLTFDEFKILAEQGKI